MSLPVARHIDGSSAMPSALIPALLRDRGVVQFQVLRLLGPEQCQPASGKKSVRRNGSGILTSCRAPFMRSALFGFINVAVVVGHRCRGQELEECNTHIKLPQGISFSMLRKGHAHVAWSPLHGPDRLLVMGRLH